MSKLQDIRITNDWLVNFKNLVKDSNLNIYNILVEPVDNAIDAMAHRVVVDYQTYENTMNLRKLIITNFGGTGLTDDFHNNRLIKFPVTEYSYKPNSIGANGYGIKGVAMRIGAFYRTWCKTDDSDLFRLKEWIMIDKDGKEHSIFDMLRYRNQNDNRFLDITYMRHDIVEFKIVSKVVDKDYVLEQTGDEEFANSSVATKIELGGCDDNNLKLTAEDFTTVKQYAKSFYGHMDFELEIKLKDEQGIIIEPFQFPVQGYPSNFNGLKKLPDITVDGSKNEYSVYYFYTLSPKHDMKKLDDYNSVVPKDNRHVTFIDGTKIRSDQQFIHIYDYTKRGIRSYKLMKNDHFYGNKHNGMNIILVSKKQLKNLDKFKFLGFDSDEEIKSIRKILKGILKTDSDGKMEYVNPNWEKEKQEEVAQTQQLVDDIIAGTDKWRHRWIEKVGDRVEAERITTEFVKDSSNWEVTSGNIEGNQIDIMFGSKVIVEVENQDSKSSKDHLEKINLWYDEIIQTANKDYEWIVWLAKSHSFEKRLKKLLKNKPCTNDTFKGFILLNWKDLYCQDEDDVNTKYVKVDKSPNIVTKVA